MELTKTSFKVRFKYGLWLRVQYVRARVCMCMFMPLCLFMYSTAGYCCIALHGIYESPFAIGVDSKLVQASVASI